VKALGPVKGGGHLLVLLSGRLEAFGIGSHVDTDCR
jgi:hypothetical protein